ncbi:MAG: response regulator [Burkholderiales bacterium]
MGATRKILVVDDDPVVGKSFDRVLSNKGYVVITASNGEEALRKIKNEHYDLVFTDIKMPGMSGIEVAERVKASQPWLPVVIVTGYGSGANVTRAEAAGVSGFLNKPLSPEMIEESAESALCGPVVARAIPKSIPRILAVAPAEVNAPAEEVPAIKEAKGVFETVKNIVLFFASPFIGLAYLFAMPFVGGAALVWLAGKTLVKKVPAVKTIGLLCAAPFIGLAYFLALPFAGMGMLAWYGTKALVRTN